MGLSLRFPYLYSEVNETFKATRAWLEKRSPLGKTWKQNWQVCDQRARGHHKPACLGHVPSTQQPINIDNETGPPPACAGHFPPHPLKPHIWKMGINTITPQGLLGATVYVNMTAHIASNCISCDSACCL